jgi:BMFP domain-containing protein YqiC
MADHDEAAPAHAISQPILAQLDELIAIRVGQATATLQARVDELERRLTAVERGKAGPAGEPAPPASGAGLSNAETP